MATDGQVEIEVGIGKPVGFLVFFIQKLNEVGKYRVTAGLKAGMDKTKYNKWKCNVVIGYKCMGCRRKSSLSEQLRVSLSSEGPSEVICARSLGCVSYHDLFKFTLSVFLDQPMEKMAEIPAILEIDESLRFVDEAEAKKLNANCKVFFQDSDKPVFINRELLADYSKVFRQMFEEDLKTKNAEEIKLEVDRQDFLSFLNCFYFPPAPLTMQNFKTVFIVAERYKCHRLVRKCITFMDGAMKSVSTIEEFRYYIELSERYGWNKHMAVLMMMLKRKGIMFFIELLDAEWMMARKKNTRHTLLEGMKSLFPLAEVKAEILFVEPSQKNKKMRFTEIDEAKKLHMDCSIYVKDSNEPVFVHRGLLNAYSNFFRVMSEDEFNRATLNLDVDRDDLVSFLDCLYVPVAPVTVHNFKTVALMAERFDCPQLMEKCKEFAEEGLKISATTEACKDYLEVAEKLGWDHVVTIVVDSMKKRGANFFMKLIDSDSIETLTKNTQKALFKGLKEVILFHAK